MAEITKKQFVWDMLGQPLHVGYAVIVNTIGFGGSSHLRKAVITKIDSKRVYLKTIVVDRRGVTVNCGWTSRRPNAKSQVEVVAVPLERAFPADEYDVAYQRFAPTDTVGVPFISLKQK